MKVTLIANTDIAPGAFDVMPWGTPSRDADYLAEFAGRACYQSFHRPNPATAENIDYLRNVIGKGHESILEHATATFYITGVSRSLTHELIRHRHLSVSEMSQRYVDLDDVEFVDPPAVRDNANVDVANVHRGPDRDTVSIREMVDESRREASFYYDTLADTFARWMPRKQARETARSRMPNDTETRIVVTGNMRAWRHVLRLRGTVHADAEIRELAVRLLDELYELAPATFDDMAVTTLADGREVIE